MFRSKSGSDRRPELSGAEVYGTIKERFARSEKFALTCAYIAMVAGITAGLVHDHESVQKLETPAIATIFGAAVAGGLERLRAIASSEAAITTLAASKDGIHPMARIVQEEITVGGSEVKRTGLLDKRAYMDPLQGACNTLNIGLVAGLPGVGGLFLASASEGSSNTIIGFGMLVGSLVSYTYNLVETSGRLEAYGAQIQNIEDALPFEAGD